MIERPDLNYWSLGLARNSGGDYWRKPRFEVTSGMIRVGWRYTAWSLHFGHQTLTRQQLDQIIDQGKKLEQALDLYDGEFPLDRLRPGQKVRQVAGNGACEVGNDQEGWTRINIGDPLPPKPERWQRIWTRPEP